MRNAAVAVSMAILLACLPESVAGADPVPLAEAPADEPGLCPFDEGPVLAERMTFQAEYVVWFLRRGHMPPLLTTSSVASGGQLGRPDTRVLFGDERIESRHYDRFIGTRLTLDLWLNPERTLGLEGRAFLLERDSTHFKAVSDGSTLLARPFFNALDGSAASEIIAGPTPAGLRSGGFVGYSRIELFGEEANLIVPLRTEPGFRLDAVAGARFLQMRDRTDLTAASKIEPAQAILFGLTDHIRVHNAFYGGQLGLRTEINRGRWFVNLRTEAALGGNRQLIRTFGDRVFATPSVRVEEPFGLAILPSNSGRFDRVALDWAGELAFNFGFAINACTRIFAGYTLLYWHGPLRSGDQIDLVVNPTQLPGALTGPARPAILWKEDPFWAHGANVGLEFRW